MQQPDDNEDGALIRLETDLPAVQLSTIHASKGLEYPVVFCPFVWQAKTTKPNYPVVRKATGGILDLGGDDFEEHQQAASEQEREEQQRLLYVALTRARHRCYVGLAATAKGRYGEPLASSESILAHLLNLNDVPPESWREQLGEQLPLLDQHLLAADHQSITNPDVPIDTSQEVAEPNPRVCPQWGWRTTSFSALSSGSQQHELHQDHDEISSANQADDERLSLKPGLLVGLSGGTELGNRVHNILEEIIGNYHDLETAMTTTGQADETLQQAMGQILNTAISLPGYGKIGRMVELQGSSIAELHFVLPVDQLQANDLSRALLSDPLIAHHDERRAWAEGINHWTFAKLRGFIQGYIDLTICHNERWFVVDYKTNQLPDYDLEHCDSAMREHDYLLQGRLYLVALHRHLKQNLSGYTIEEHLGGIGYWFVRGFPDGGMWQERPSAEAVRALDALFAPGILEGRV